MSATVRVPRADVRGRNQEQVQRGGQTEHPARDPLCATRESGDSRHRGGRGEFGGVHDWRTGNADEARGIPPHTCYFSVPR